MMTLLATLLGFISSAFPDVLRLVRDSADRKHELAILQMQIEQQRQGHVNRLEEIQIAADGIEARALYKTYSIGIKWVDALNGTVRPVLAYSFFLLYAAVKWAQISMLLNHSPVIEALSLIWHEEDQTIFAGIISFYFGQRAFSKTR
jgi:hypothetical protein